MPDVYKQITFENIVLTVLAVVVLAVCIGCVYAFVRAIIGFIFSHGDAEKIKKAYTSIRFMILGMFLTITLLFVFPLVFKWMKIPNAEDYTAKWIFNRVGEIIKSLSTMWTWLKDYQTDQQNPYTPPASQYQL